MNLPNSEDSEESETVVESRHSLSDRSKFISSFHLNKWLEDECDIHNHLAETEELNSNAIYYARKLNPQT